MKLCEYHSDCYYVNENCYDGVTQNVQNCFIYKGLKEKENRIKLNKGLISKLGNEKDN